jgi:hypothetical protein
MEENRLFPLIERTVSPADLGAIRLRTRKRANPA